MLTKLGLDAYQVLRGVAERLSDGFEGRQKTPRQKTEDKKKKRASALERFGRNLTELAAKGALPPLIGRRKEMLKITQILLQSRKSKPDFDRRAGRGQDRDRRGLCTIAV